MPNPFRVGDKVRALRLDDGATVLVAGEVVHAGREELEVEFVDGEHRRYLGAGIDDYVIAFRDLTGDP